jgi:hypothetical protein
MLMDAGKQGLKKGFVIKNMLHWGLAVCLPTDLIEEMIKFGDTMNIPQDDARISYFLQRKKMSVYYPMPCLVDHRVGKSLVNDPGRNRTAYKFIDDVEQPKWPWGNRKNWPDRAKAIAEIIPPEASVLDLGGGFSYMRELLPNNKYVSVDKQKWTPGTIQADFNKGEFPDLGKFDVIICQGILEYINSPIDFLLQIHKYGRRLIISYYTGKFNVQDRKNNFNFEQVEALLDKTNWQIICQRKSTLYKSGNEEIYICTLK